MEGCIGSWCGDLPCEWDTPKAVKWLFGQHFYEAVISRWYKFLGIFTAPRETLCRWSISLCLSDGKREQRPSCSAWSPWCQLWSLSQGKAHHNYLPTTQITAAVLKLHFHHICSGFTHGRNVMFVRKMGCYLMVPLLFHKAPNHGHIPPSPLILFSSPRRADICLGYLRHHSYCT